MRFTLFALFLGATAIVAGPIAGPRIVVEERKVAPKTWKRHHLPLDRRTVLPLRIGLKHGNEHLIEQELLAISDPDSPMYGQHWDHAKVRDFFKPSDETVNTVKQWLKDEGISSEIKTSLSGAWLNVRVTVAEAERLLDARYESYLHQPSGEERIGCNKYSVPAHVHKHLDLITPTVHFDHSSGRAKHLDTEDTKPQMIKREAGANEERGLLDLLLGNGKTTTTSTKKSTTSSTKAKSTSTTSAKTTSATAATAKVTGVADAVVSSSSAKSTSSSKPTSSSKTTTRTSAAIPTGNAMGDSARHLGYPGVGVASPKVASGGFSWPVFNLLGLGALDDCDSATTIVCLKYLYNFASYIIRAPSENSLGIVEYTPQAYVASDLDMFFKNYSSNMVGRRPTLAAIAGGSVQTTDTGFDYNAESNLDLEYGMALTYPTKTVLYQTGTADNGASFNNLLDALDATYCSYLGGNDPLNDAVTDLTGLTCGGAPQAKVIASSYGYNEADLTPAYEIRQCNEYAKLGLLGITMLYAAGDFGVAGSGDSGAICVDPATGEYNDGTSGAFAPSFPGTCPYVTSVGGTQLPTGTNSNTNLVSEILSWLLPSLPDEVACETVIYSGGGFSNVFALPTWQSSQMATYYKKYKPSYTAMQYNNSQAVRGIPDISANAANYIITINGEYGLVYGTSASTPVVGAIFTLINDARIFLGKSSIGFVNPTLYSSYFASTFNDITSGSNPGCGTNGFSAVPGWDPVTGLGTPNFQAMLAKWILL